MPRVFKKSIVRYLDADGRQVPKDTPGARKIKEKSAKWYGRVPGRAKPVPLCRLSAHRWDGHRYWRPPRYRDG